MYTVEQYALKGDKLVITLRGKAPLVAEVEIPAAEYNEAALKGAIEAALEGECVCSWNDAVLLPPH